MMPGLTKYLHYIPLLMVGILLCACNGTSPVKDTEVEEEKFELAFPPIPDIPRFYYEMTFIHSNQLKERSEDLSWREILTGEKEGASGAEGLAKPYDVTACGGRVYISDTVRRQVAVFDVNNRSYFTIGKKEPGILRKPLGLDSDADCNIYVADTTLNSVMVYDSKGQFIRALGGKEWFHRLSHVAINPQGTRVYAVDTGGVQTEAHRIRVFDTQSGEHLHDIGTRGTEQGQFNLPKDIDIGTDGKVFVVDSGNFRVQVFDQEGTFIRTFGTVGNRSGQFARPKGVATDPDGNIYVADTSFANFQIFSAEGRLLMHIGERSDDNKPAGYMLPSGIDVDADGRIYFVDQFYRKVDVFRPAALPAGHGAIGHILHPESGGG